MSNQFVMGFQRISINEAEILKIVNKCEKMEALSGPWDIYYGTVEQILLPPPLLEDLIGEVLDPSFKTLVIFESKKKAYAVICQTSFWMQVMQVAAFKGSKAAFTMISKIAQGN